MDQLLFRFGKLQDALGERLIPATLAQLAEPFEDWPMRDRLNRLEKLGYLNVDDWLRWRAVRNRLAHEYPDAPELRLASLRGGIQAARELLHAYAHWRSQLAAVAGFEPFAAKPGVVVTDEMVNALRDAEGT